MEYNSHFLFKKTEDKTITWFKNTNEYLVLENLTSEIIKNLDKKIAKNDIAKIISNKIEVPLDVALNFVTDVEQNLYIPNTINPLQKTQITTIKIPNNFQCIKFYKIDSLVIKVNYATEKELNLIHPKFSYLETNPSKNKHTFTTFTKNKITFLFVDDKYIGSWSNADLHFFQGKFSMQIVQKMHQKEESDWMGVFHASAVGNGKKSMLFLGDSGNGKSTSLALLQAYGFTCIADDFVPIDAKKQEVYSFPAAISIKKKSLDTLLPFYPELQNCKEYHFKTLNKIVRYLQPNNPDIFAHLPCNQLVFIKYTKDSKCICVKISKIDAFKKLVPDSWISKEPKNANTFLNWFEGLNCYKLTYSDTKDLIDTVSKLFNDAE